jgi:hypothetical protein
VYLCWDSLLIVDDDAPTKVKFLVFDLEQSARLQERKAVVGMGDHVSEVGRHLLQLSSVFPVVSDGLFIGDYDLLLLFLFLSELCYPDVSQYDKI